MTCSDVGTDDLAESLPPDVEVHHIGDIHIKKKQRFSELTLRIVAAVFMAPAGVFVVLQGGLWLITATAVCAVIAAYEWWRMTNASIGRKDSLPGLLLMSLAFASVCSGALGLKWVVGVSITSSLLMLIWGSILQFRPLALMFGGLYVTLPFGAFIHIREDWPQGAVTLLICMLLVWTTDIAAFLAGRGFGGPRIAPQKSPNKTWTGSLGALVCTVLAGAALARFANLPLIYMCVIAGMLSIIAQGGDLLESWFKRKFGVKDASGVIPGHGGVLDRLDSLMAVVVFAAIAGALAPNIVPAN